MAAQENKGAHQDPNFAVICSFLEQFGPLLSIDETSFTTLQIQLEDTRFVSSSLEKLLIKLIRRWKSSMKADKWETYLVKFCYTYCEMDAWELERFGFARSKLETKLRILKNLLELQFDVNTKFKEKVNEKTSTDMRILPIGCDRNGLAYWYLLDKDLNVRVYREEQDDQEAESWEVVVRNREDLASLIASLEAKKDALWDEASGSVTPSMSGSRCETPSDKIFTSVDPDDVKQQLKLKIKCNLSESGYKVVNDETNDIYDGDTDTEDSQAATEDSQDASMKASNVEDGSSNLSEKKEVDVQESSSQISNEDLNIDGLAANALKTENTETLKTENESEKEKVEDLHDDKVAVMEDIKTEINKDSDIKVEKQEEIMDDNAKENEQITSNSIQKDKEEIKEEVQIKDEEEREQQKEEFIQQVKEEVEDEAKEEAETNCISDGKTIKQEDPMDNCVKKEMQPCSEKIEPEEDKADNEIGNDSKNTPSENEENDVKVSEADDKIVDNDAKDEEEKEDDDGRQRKRKHKNQGSNHNQADTSESEVSDTPFQSASECDEDEPPSKRKRGKTLKKTLPKNKSCSKPKSDGENTNDPNIGDSENEETNQSAKIASDEDPQKDDKQKKPDAKPNTPSGRGRRKRGSGQQRAETPPPVSVEGLRRSSRANKGRRVIDMGIVDTPSPRKSRKEEQRQQDLEEKRKKREEKAQRKKEREEKRRRKEEKLLKKKKKKGCETSDEEFVPPGANGGGGKRGRRKRNASSSLSSSSSSEDSEFEEALVAQHEAEDDDELRLSAGVASEVELDSDVDDEEYVPTGRNARRQEQLKQKAAEVEEELWNCHRCGKGDHPEWILLCDGCDIGYHTSCLRPPLMIIPHGDWFCPPCQHKTLIQALAEKLGLLDAQLKENERLIKRKERLAFVNISLNNVITHEGGGGDEEEEEADSYEDDDDREARKAASRKARARRQRHRHRRRRKYFYDWEQGSSSEQQQESEESEEESEDQEEYSMVASRSKRQRKDINYKFEEYDEIIDTAIKEEAKVPVYMGKDIRTIVAAAQQERHQEEEQQEEEQVRAPRPPPVSRSKGKSIENITGMREVVAGEPEREERRRRKKARRLTALESGAEEEEEDDTDEYKATDDSVASGDDKYEIPSDVSEESLDDYWTRKERKETHKHKRHKSHRSSRKKKSHKRYESDDSYDGESSDYRPSKHKKAHTPQSKSKHTRGKKTKRGICYNSESNGESDYSQRKVKVKTNTKKGKKGIVYSDEEVEEKVEETEHSAQTKTSDKENNVSRSPVPVDKQDHNVLNGEDDDEVEGADDLEDVGDLCEFVLGT